MLAKSYIATGNYVTAPSIYDSGFEANYKQAPNLHMEEHITSPYCIFKKGLNCEAIQPIPFFICRLVAPTNLRLA